MWHFNINVCIANFGWQLLHVRNKHSTVCVCKFQHCGQPQKTNRLIIMYVRSLRYSIVTNILSCCSSLVSLHFKHFHCSDERKIMLCAIIEEFWCCWVIYCAMTFEETNLRPFHFDFVCQCNFEYVPSHPSEKVDAISRKIFYSNSYATVDFTSKERLVHVTFLSHIFHQNSCLT